MPMLGFMNLGVWEILAIALVALLLFGRRLPEVGRSFGQGIVQFKKGLKDVQDDIEKSGDEPGSKEKKA